MDSLKSILWFILLFSFVGKLNCTHSQFFLYVQSNINGGLNCLNTESSRIETIKPDVNLPITTSLTIQSCQLLKTTLIHQLINNLGLERLTRLEFNFKNNNEIALSYFRFNGFNLEDFILEDVQYTQKIKNGSEVDANEPTLPIELLQSRDKLQVLRLSVGLTTLSESMLSNLTNLKSLYLQNNELVVIPPDAVKNLENLETFDLSHNKLKNLTMQQFPNLKQLKNVNLSSNEINHMFFNTFGDNENLEVVDLQNNLIFRLPDKLFSRFPKLIKVNLSNCKLKSLPNLIFYLTQSLQTINLSFNEIKFLPQRLFHSLTELKYLDLSSNKLSDFPKDIFLNLKNLKYLNLSYNNFKDLKKVETKSLSSLEELNLKCNQLVTKLADFRFSKKLYYINLSHNNLKNFVLSSTSLRKIDLSHNKLAMIGGWISQIKDLMYLDASFNKITSLDINFFLQFTHLSTLNFSNNRISTIKFFDMERLGQHQHENNLVIKLKKNSIKCDCHLTNFVRYFEESLNPIVRERITIIKVDDLVCESPENFKNQLVKNLNPSMLTCPYDYFFVKKCSDVCDCYVRLWDDAIIVDCENKNLTEVPKLNLQLSHIVEVNLQNNFLISGPNHSMGYENVTKLLLSNNNITDLAWMPPRLKTLTLNHNSFRVFDRKMSNLLSSAYLFNISLGDNPWTCKCFAKILHNYLSMHNSSKLIDIQSIRCIENRTKIIDLNVDHLCKVSYLDMIFSYSLDELFFMYSMEIFIILNMVLIVVIKSYQKERYMEMFENNKMNIKCITLWLLIIVNSSFQCKIPIQCDCYLDQQRKFEYECPEIQIFANHNFLSDLTCKNQYDFNIDEILNEIDIESFHYRSNIEKDLEYEINIEYGTDIKVLQLARCRLFPSFPNISDSESDGLESMVYYYRNNFRSFSLTSDNFYGLEGIRRLILLNANEEDNNEQDVRLTPDTFKYLSELRYLKCIIPLETLPIGVFDNLHYLETLLLPSNNLDNLRADVLKNLHNLISLDLSNNYLKEIPKDIFKKNINLKAVNLNHNFLITLPSNLFANLSKLTQISISKCELDDLSENLFQGSNSLEEINLSWNYLKSLPENIFKDLNSLKRLDLSNNRIRKIPGTIFDPLRSLRILNLSDNELVRLNRNQFGGLKLVEIIDMSNNNLITIYISLFRKTVNLKELYFQNNFLKISRKKMEYYLFHNTHNLEIINLSNNNLTFFQVCYVSNKSKLRKLDLSYNQIESISIHQFQSDSKEIVIDLRNNKISSIDFDDIENVSNHRNIAYKNRNVIIKLDENPIHCDCFSYSFLKYLNKTIKFPIPKFIEIEADNLKCSSSNRLAKYLNLESVTCSLEDFSLPKCSDVCNCYYRPWSNSVTADCENKKLTRVPEIILPYNISKIISNLVDVEINLRNNLLISAPNVTVGYKNITKLFLSSNNIGKINWIPPNLKVLELNNNNLSSFDENVLAKINSFKLDSITLGNNPWNCDCSSLHLYKFLLSNKNSKHIDVGNITCAHLGKGMILLTPEDLCSTINTHVISVACVVIILAFCSMVIIYHCQGDKIKIWLYAHKVCMWFVKEEDLDKDKIYDAFISYSHMDEDFILNELQPSLESEPNPYKLCLHVRDWVPGKEIAKQINASIEKSKRTVVILSPHFLESVWGILEFRIAHIQATQEGRARIILVIYGDLNFKNLDDEMKTYIETNTYIKWGDPWFWSKLKYALPHRT